MLNKDFQYIVDKQLGVPRDARPLTAEQIVYARDHLPSSYVDFLVDFGLGNYFKRGIQFCDPQEFRPLMALIFKTDSEFSHKDCHTMFQALNYFQLNSLTLFCFLPNQNVRRRRIRLHLG
jgi:hypothetical protein